MVSYAWGGECLVIDWQTWPGGRSGPNGGWESEPKTPGARTAYPRREQVGPGRPLRPRAAFFRETADGPGKNLLECRACGLSCPCSDTNDGKTGPETVPNTRGAYREKSLRQFFPNRGGEGAERICTRGARRCGLRPIRAAVSVVAPLNRHEARKLADPYVAGWKSLDLARIPGSLRSLEWQDRRNPSASNDGSCLRVFRLTGPGGGSEIGEEL